MTPTGWNAAAPATRLLLLAVVVACASTPLTTLISYIAVSLNHGEILLPFPDFYGFWTYATFAQSHPPAQLYDDDIVGAYQTAGGLTEGSYPFLYPPPILVFLYPFGLMPYGTARLVWLVLGLGAYVAALRAWRWRPLLMAALILAPTTYLGIVAGQNGFFSAALMLGGLCALPERPVLGGVLLGLLAYKPQLWILVPLVLLFDRRRVVLVSVALTLAAMAAASAALFGPEIWVTWFTHMAGEATSLASGRGHLNPKMPTVTSAVLQWGGTSATANLAQLAAALVGAWAVWRARGTLRGATGRAVIPAATLFATPHFFYYDMTLITGSVLAIFAERMTTGAAIGRVEMLVLIAALLTTVGLKVQTATGATVTAAVLLVLVLTLAASARRTPAGAGAAA